MNITREQRKWAYNVGIAAVAVAVIYGLIDGDIADTWVALLGAALGIARANLSDD